MKYTLFLCLLLSGVCQADDQRVTLAVSGMNCITCPITVRKALENVDGVASVTVDAATQRAQVVFDDRQTQVDTLLQATRQAGYPASIAEEPQHD